MIKQPVVIISAVLTLLCGCSQSQTKSFPENISTAASISTLNKTELLVLDSLQFDITIGESIKAISGDTLKRLLSYYYARPQDHMDTIYDKGLQLETTSAIAKELVNTLGELFAKKGYIIFIAESNFGYQKDKVGIFKTTDQFDVLKYRGTDAGNYGHNNVWVITKAKEINKKYPFRITGADMDWFEAKFITPPADWLKFAKELYKICPDIVEQGTGTVEALAKEMEQTQILYLWWD